uniref:DUF7870 domain-containing protein n=1 Tax=Cajanus cajan TaxID=3821 RepID=A0A151TUX1_CAJCA|nr:hypothetical protein KK1_010107 [Cajanus cajan]
MDAKLFKLNRLTAAIARRLAIRSILLASAISIVSLFHAQSIFNVGSLAPIATYFDCVTFRPASRFWLPSNCHKDANLTLAVVTDLMGNRLLHPGANTLCVGQASSIAVTAIKQLGFSTVSADQTHRFGHNTFDFVFSRDLDKVPVPASHVLEVERVLKPAGVGAFLVSSIGSHPNDLIRAATPVSSLLSLTFTKPLIELMEPLVSGKEKEKAPPESVPYLPKFVDVSTRKRLVYIDIGVGELLNANASDWFLPSYPIDQKDFNVYFVHYNTSIMLSYVKRPGVTFVYHPGLAGKVTPKPDDDGVDPFVGEEEFDFLAWFKETVQYADFVILKMNAGDVELKFLWDIFENGAICFVDEMFLRCPESSKEGCMDIYKGLRSNGVYVHQWWGD